MTRGHPTNDFDQRADDVSLEHPEVVEHYRRDHQIACAHARDDAGTEDLDKPRSPTAPCSGHCSMTPPRTTAGPRTASGPILTAVGSRTILTAVGSRTTARLRRWPVPAKRQAPAIGPTGSHRLGRRSPPRRGSPRADPVTIRPPRIVDRARTERGLPQPLGRGAGRFTRRWRFHRRVADGGYRRRHVGR